MSDYEEAEDEALNSKRDFLSISTNKVVASNPSECSLARKKAHEASGRKGPLICSTSTELDAMKRMIKTKTGSDSFNHKSDFEVVEKAKLITKCNSESCVYNQPDFADEMGMEQFMIESLMNTRFMGEGPHDNANPLTNFNIKGVMQQFDSVYPDFQEIPFQMMDFMEPKGHNALRDFNFDSAFRNGKRTFAVIINTDRILPNDTRKTIGKHWFCLFFDFRSLPSNFFSTRPARKTSTKKKSLGRNVITTRSCQIEYFNSSGRAPYKEVREYFTHVKSYFETHYPEINLWQLSSNQAQQQYSDTQCGVYSLCYIEERLKGTPYCFFLKFRITDADMAKLRKALFRHTDSRKRMLRR